MENQTVEQLIQEYGMRLGELEGYYYQLNGYYPSFDSHEFWEDKAVAYAETLNDFWWEIKKIRDTGRVR